MNQSVKHQHRKSPAALHKQCYCTPTVVQLGPFELFCNAVYERLLVFLRTNALRSAHIFMRVLAFGIVQILPRHSYGFYTKLAYFT